MCLILTKRSKVKIANKDKVCYKVLKYSDNKYLTPLMYDRVQLNTYISVPEENFKITEEEISDKGKCQTITDGAIHLYKFKLRAKYMARRLSKYFDGRCNYIVVKAIIPAGTKYINGITETDYLCCATKAVIYKY